jgi:hypothetical protein
MQRVYTRYQVGFMYARPVMLLRCLIVNRGEFVQRKEYV